MSQQYLRTLSLVVADPSGAGIDLGALRCVFEVRRGDRQTPNSCDVKVYNLSTSTANRVSSPEFTQLALKVGYQDQQLQLIFRGSIKQVRKGREDQKNSYVAITAADGDEAYNFSAVALTLAAGATPSDAVSAMIANMATAAVNGAAAGGSQPISAGYIPPLNPNRTVRGRTYYGLCRDELRDIAAHTDCKWSIQDGQVVFVPNTGYIPGAPVLITPYTGLIGVPEQTQNGLEMTVLLNPGIKIGQTVKLDSSDVNQYRYGLDSQSVALNKLLAQSTTKLNADGFYYVMRAEHSGDTRGTAWYTTLTCLAVDAKVPLINVEQAAILPSGAVPRN